MLIRQFPYQGLFHVPPYSRSLLVFQTSPAQLKYNRTHHSHTAYSIPLQEIKKHLPNPIWHIYKGDGV